MNVEHVIVGVKYREALVVATLEYLDLLDQSNRRY